MNKILGYIGIGIVVLMSALAFLPNNNLSKLSIGFEGYEEVVKNASKNENIKQNEETNEEDLELDGNKSEKEKNIERKMDSLEFNRQVEDTINSFIFAIKSNKYDDAEKCLTEFKTSDKKKSVMYLLKYNQEYTFFRNYLVSFEVFLNSVEQTTEGALANIKIRRYDINKLHKRLLEEQYESIEQYENATYEDILFQNEEYFKNEFVKSNVPIKNDNYNITLVKILEQDDSSKDVNNNKDNRIEKQYNQKEMTAEEKANAKGEWKIVNDENLANVIINMDFMINKNSK